MIHEHEPLEAFALLADDDIDLALTYDYNLAPASLSPPLEAVPLWTDAVGPRRARPATRRRRRPPADFARFRDHPGS